MVPRKVGLPVWSVGAMSLSFGLLPVALSCSGRAPAPRSVDLAVAQDVSVPPAVTVACAPEAEQKTEGPALGLLRQPASARMEDAEVRSAVYAVGEFPGNPSVLRPGPEDDRHLIDVYCVDCHSSAYITMQPPLSRAQWEAEVAKMRAAFGAVVPDPAAQRIATFLHAYYGRK